MVAAEKFRTVDTVFSKTIFVADGFAIFKTNDGFSAKGNIIDAPETLIDTPILLLGEWDTYKGQRTFAFRSYQIQENQIYFFLTRMVGNIPASTAREIVAAVGDRLPEIMETSPDSLAKFKGIGPKKLIRIKAKWESFKHVRRLGEILLPYGITNNLILRIHEHFGDKAVDVTMQDTYRLTEVRGVGFKTADEVAIKLGVPHNDPRRLAACALYCLTEKMAGEGNTAITVEDLEKSISEEIASDGLGGDIASSHADITRIIGALIEADKIAVVIGKYPDKDAYLTLPWLLRMEKRIMELCKLRRNGQATKDIETWIVAYEKRFGRPLGDQQRQAVRIANTLPAIVAVSGYAGTGKTTTSRAILELYTEIYPRDSVFCCALSGVAANRVQNQSGFPGATIHSLLGYKGGSDWTFNASNKLACKVVLLDEASMDDSELMFRLLSAIDFEGGSHLIILGDPAQLPPVGAGAPFADMLAFNLVPHVVLDKIYRQSEDKVITTFAASVRHGEVPPGYRNHYADFKFIEKSIPDYWQLRKTLPESEMKDLREKNNNEIRESILAIAQRRKSHMDGYYEAQSTLAYLLDFQVLSPIKDGAAGVRSLNQGLQEVLNPPTGGPEMKVGERRFRTRDKIVHLINKNLMVVPVEHYENYLFEGDDVLVERRVYNGQFGALTLVDGEGDDMELHVLFPSEGYVAIYPRTDVSNYVIDLAYCLSVHKSQGSEFAHVVMPVTLSHYNMLDPKLLYTAMTRAKNALVMVGQPYAFELGCKKMSRSERKTCIKLLAA